MRLLLLPVIVVLIAASTVLHVLPLLALALAKAVVPSTRARRLATGGLTAIAESWIGFNSALVDRFSGTRLVVDIDATLRRDGRYLVLSNHQSWVDIVMLQRVFNRRIPLMRFFLKRQLIWVPLLGMAWWALDFPFMTRATPAQIARNPRLAGRDREATRRACAKFRTLPVAIVNFAEGTRFTAAKHAAQHDSGLRHLLRPKAGGVAFVLDAMDGALESVLDVTLAYPHGTPTLLDLLAGRVPEVRVHAVERPIPAGVCGDYATDPDTRARVQAWINAVWAEKDARLDAIRSLAVIPRA